MYLQTEEIRKSRPTSDWKQANQSIHSSNYHRDNYSWRRFYFIETDFIHDFTTIPLIFARAVRRIDGITGMSRGISEGRQKKKLPIRLKAVEFFYSLKTKWWFNSHTKWTVRVSSSFNPRRTCKFIPAPWCKGSWWTPPPPRVFDLLQYFETPLIDLIWRYILWVVALLGACDVTNNGHHFGRHLVFY